MQSIEDIISGASRGGWDWFDQADPAIREKLDVRKQLEGENASAISRAWADFAADPAGAKAIEALFNATLNRTVFFVALGLDPVSMATFGAFREGQNALAHEIARHIARGRAEPVPAPRDV